VNLARELTGLERLRPVLDALPGPAFLVGGTVRELLLGHPSRFDFDLAVVGDGESFARALAERLGGRVTTHGRVGTATVNDGDAARVDVATARTETYPAPAALPDVAPAASIEEDLARRDFTINAMAISLPDGELVDPFHGRQHLEEQLVRVLHEGSFVDDPTRIFRAVRYETRLGFRLDPKTETLSLIARPELRRLSGARVREELIALLEEDEAPAAVQRLQQLGVDAALHPGLSFREGRLVARLRELAARYHLPRERWELGLLAIAPPPGWLDELKFPRAVVERVERAVSEAPALRTHLRGSWLAPAEVVDAIERTGADTPLLALAQEDLPLLRDYFERWRNVQLELTGDDLAALGLGESPRVGEVLAELRRRKLNGGLSGRAEELAAARELISE
jgi:tRNA nucleotidyltransferase (CCA-adding enzyme)